MQMDRDQAKSDRLLIVADQFEEVFTLCHNEAERAAFIQKLIALAQHASHTITVVIALRADFYSYCAQYPALRKAVAAQQEYIGQMTAEELRRAIEEPARYGKWEFEPGLVDMLLQDVGADGTGHPEPGALPLLSHALLATWEHRRGRTFTLDGYHTSGGVRGAIAETAESVFTDQLNREGQELARSVFLRLTELGEGTEDTRRRAALNELVNRSEQASQLRAVLNTLAEARLITLNEDSAEVAHEALIREWERLHDWLTQDRDGLRLHRHLTESAREWETRGRDISELYRGARLAQAREWAAINEAHLNESERLFLATSIEHEQKEAIEREAQSQRELAVARELAETQRQSASRLRIRNRVITVVGGLAVLAAIIAASLGGSASRAAQSNATLAAQNAAIASTAQAANTQVIEQRNAAVNAQAIAETNFIHAEAQRLAYEATNIMSGNRHSTTAALLALRSLNLEYTPQGDASLLQALNLNYPLQTFTSSNGIVTKVAFSQDDKLILTGNDDGTARLFDAQSGQELQVFSGHTAQVNSIAFSADGKLILTCSADKTARLWDATTGKEVQTFSGHTDVVITAIFSLDGRHILTGSEDKTMRLWDIETGKELNQWFLEEPVSAISADGNYAVGYSEDDNANHLWDIKTFTKIHSFTYTGQPLRYPIQFSPDGKYLLAAYGKEIVLSDVLSGLEVQVFKGHTDAVYGVDLSSDGNYMISASADGTARLWDVQTGQELRRFSDHAGIVESIGFSSDGQKMLTGGEEGTVFLWNIDAHPELPVFNGGNDMYGAAFSPDGKLMATNTIGNELRLWNVSTGQTLWQAQDSGVALWALKYSPDGKYLISGNMDGVTTLWDAKTGEAVRRFTAKGLDEIYALDFSPDGKTIIAGGSSSKTPHETFAPLWDVETGREILRLPLPSLIYTASFSPDGKYILTGGAEKDSLLWDAQTGKRLRDFPGSLAVLSPDDKYVFNVGGDKGWVGTTGFVWDIQTGQEVSHFEGPASGFWTMVYSPDGKTVAAISADSIYWWDIQTGQKLRRYVFTAPVNNITFSPDSKYLITVSTDGIARFFDVDYHATMKYLCSILLRDLKDEERAQYGITDNTPTCPKP